MYKIKVLTHILIFLHLLAICVFKCKGSVVHKQKRLKIPIGRKQNQPLLWLNCAVCRRKIFNSCCDDLRNFIKEQCPNVTAPGRIGIPAVLRRKFRCSDCRITGKIHRYDGRVNKYCVSFFNITIIIITINHLQKKIIYRYWITSFAAAKPTSNCSGAYTMTKSQTRIWWHRSKSLIWINRWHWIHPLRKHPPSATCRLVHQTTRQTILMTSKKSPMISNM